MKEQRGPTLVVHDGNRKALGQKMLRAFLDHRYEEARAIAARLAHQADLHGVAEDDARHATSASADPERM